MKEVKNNPIIDPDFQPFVDRLLTPFPLDYYAEEVIARFWEKYKVQDALRYLFEMQLRTAEKTNDLKTKLDDLHEFMEDMSDLLMAVFIKTEDKRRTAEIEKLWQKKISEEEFSPFFKLFSSETNITNNVSR